MKWWLSFASDDGFRGAVITEAPNFLMAVTMANFAKCNPGGEVHGFEIPEDIVVPAKWMNRLLSKGDCKAFDKVTGGDGHVVNVATGEVT